MKEFVYECLDLKGKKIINHKSFALLIVAQLSNVLLQEQYVLMLSEESHHLVVDYKAASLHYIDSITKSEDKAQPLTYLTKEIKDNIIKAGEIVSNYGGKLLYMSDLDELRHFIKEVFILTVGGFKIEGDYFLTPNGMQYSAKLTMDYNDNLWEWQINTENDKGLFVGKSVNGLPISREHETTHYQNTVLETVIATIIDEELTKKETEEGLKDPRVVDMARSFSSVLGFETEDYIPLVLIVNAELRALNTGNSVSGIQLKRVLRSIIRAQDEVIEQLVSVLIR